MDVPRTTDAKDQAPRAEAMLDIVSKRLDAAARDIVPWFYDQMPAYYFRTHSEEEQAAHLRALVSGQVLEAGQVVALKDQSGTSQTFISPKGGMDALIAAVGQMTPGVIVNARMYATRDDLLRLDTFLVKPQAQVDASGPAFAQAMKDTKASKLLAGKKLTAFREFLATATEDCVRKFEVERAVRHFDIWRRIKDSESMDVTLEPGVYKGLSRIIVSTMGPPAHGALLTILGVLRRAGAEVTRAYADVYETPGQPLGIVSLYVRSNCKALRKEAWPHLARQLRACKWYASGHALEAYAENHGMDVDEVMLLIAAAQFAHQFLLKKDHYAFTTHNVNQAVLGYPDAARALLAYFKARFDPGLKDRVRAQRERLGALRNLRATIASDVPALVFEAMEIFVSHTLRTNYFLEDRFGLSFRMDPSVLSHLPGQEGRIAEADLPYGFFFFSGAHFRSFHVRYREMARGGVRIVPTRSNENFELEAGRLFDEVTALAKSQQHKNKDIPEGGSKAVILLEPLGDMDLAVKSMTNSLLDVLLTQGKGHSLKCVVDYVGKDEIIYLGPDEHITPEHITWIVDRARRRGYRWPAAFMSSKPRTGISHKRYGVTSLGVVVFAEEILKQLGIDPHTQPFTVKFTGGTRGDVASNAIKFLIRDYGANARIVSASDGHGALYDPAGLDHTELMRLVDGELGVAEFDKKKLKGKGAFAVHTTDQDGARLRDTLHNTAEADLFIPAGGRPDTINDGNWRDFLRADGTPTAKAIVEGANIFISPGARDRLQEKGVLIVHGASANKCGVISSSYEILAGLALDDEEFLKIKDTYVEQVLDILRQRARAEARLLIREYQAAGGETPMTELTMLLSKEINSIADMMDARLKERFKSPQDLKKDKALYSLLLDYCPPILARRFAARLTQRVPLSHLTALVASYSASRVVYAEGIGWARDLARVRDVDAVMRAYLTQEKRLAGFLEGLVKSDAPKRQEIARILLATGRKYLTGVDLGTEPY